MSESDSDPLLHLNTIMSESEAGVPSLDDSNHVAVNSPVSRCANRMTLSARRGKTHCQAPGSGPASGSATVTAASSVPLLSQSSRRRNGTAGYHGISSDSTSSDASAAHGSDSENDSSDSKSSRTARRLKPLALPSIAKVKSTSLAYFRAALGVVCKPDNVRFFGILISGILLLLLVVFISSSVAKPRRNHHSPYIMAGHVRDNGRYHDVHHAKQVHITEGRNEYGDDTVRMQKVHAHHSGSRERRFGHSPSPGAVPSDSGASKEGAGAAMFHAEGSNGMPSSSPSPSVSGPIPGPIPTGDIGIEHAEADLHDADTGDNDEQEQLDLSQDKDQATESNGPGGKQPDRQELGQRIRSMVIRTASITFEVSDLYAAYESLHTQVNKYGGYIADSQIRYGSARGSSQVAVKVPSGELDAFLDAIRATSFSQGSGVSSVSAESMRTQEVTDEYYDLRAQLVTLHASQSKMLKVLDMAKQIHEILNIQRELEQLNSRIDRLQGRVNLLSHRVSMSTVHITLSVINERRERTIWDRFEIDRTVHKALLHLMDSVAEVTKFLIFACMLGLPSLIAGLIVLFVVYNIVVCSARCLYRALPCDNAPQELQIVQQEVANDMQPGRHGSVV
jgi:Domain of unknown function (DUF4349)